MTMRKINPADTKAGARERQKFSALAKRNVFFAGLATILFLCADQVTKLAASAWLSVPLEVMPWVSLRYAENTGIAWSIQIPFAMLVILNFTLVGLFFWWAMKSLDFSKWLTVAVIALVLAGAFGNIIDRLRLGFVIDFISVGFWPVFNLADAFLSIGIFLILLFHAKIIGRG